MKRNVLEAQKRTYTWVILMILTAGTAGCGLADAVRDGVFGAISDVVSTLVTDVLLLET